MGPLTLCTLSVLLLQGEEAPRSKDSRLTMDLFAEHPQIVTPTGITVDNKGRVFVAESHTHFRPRGYDGPPADRILIFEDETGNGRAETPSVFHEGFKHIMDIEFRHDGSLYVATRMDIHRLEDTDGDSKADKITPVVKMETTGTYPHNGLSGLAFDFRGNLNFGLGENLGHAYTLVGTDGTRISGGGEGGSTYHVRHDGTKLRRTSTGWWNPFGMCVDAFGRVFGTDNDPGASPPCRLIQVIEGGDYGYEYRYGRSGLHPLVTWTGDIPGTLPMIAGTGEAPCAVIAYESDGLPQE
ncbi:MAG: dehydrogenase, partial [Planctomycetota bacterium]|nr:dehydrogenase [Planctomycetota bacterium]